MTRIPLTVQEAAAALRARELSSVELTQALIDRTDRLDPLIQAFITRTPESALAAAARADAAFAADVDRGPMQGIPFAVKDILATDDAPTTAQSLVMDLAWGAQGDGPAIARLRAAGAILMGKNTTFEFACGAPDDQKPFPVPRNPWKLDHFTGGSSSGTAAGIAAGLFLCGIGTDTSGSVRWPAAFCGISAMKATYGRVPRTGCTQNGFSLDHLGPMARSAWDCAAMLSVMAGADGVDLGAPDRPVPDYTAGLDGSIAGLRVGVVRKGHVDSPGMSPEVAAAFEESVRVFQELGAHVREVEIENYQVIADAQYINNASEKSGIYLKRHQAHWDDWGRFTRAGMAGIGHFLTAADYVQSLRVRRYGQKVMRDLMRTVDVLLTPTTKTPAGPLASVGYPQELGHAIFTGFFSFVGMPAMAIPMGFSSNGLPLSLQLAGRPWDEATVFKAADAFQRLTSWHLALPPVLAGEAAPA
jgi:aspartyl-tRNA(Asn)/glutamyl-tRNA(Gln) amidotransferase subunit A